MMKTAYRFWTYICAFLAAFALLSCEKNNGLEDGFDEGIILTLQTGGDTGMQVKGTPTEGDDDYNENLLNSVYYFFYPEGTTTAAPTVSGFKTGLSSTNTYTVKIPVSANTVVNDLFASSNECRLFAVANPPSDLVSTLEGKPSLDALRAMTVLSSLKNVPQSNLVMVYDSTLTASSLSGKIAINQTVPMEHLAVKFTLGALVIPSITQGTAIYTPDDVSVSLYNGVNRTTLRGWKKGVAKSDDYFDTDFAEMSVATPSTVVINEGEEDEETLTKYELTKPFYSYPMEWEFNSETEPYLMYDVRWKIVDGGSTSYKDLYYKLTLGSRAIKKNEWYDISAKLTVLGSLYPEEPTEIYYYMDYLVNDWKGALSDDGINTPAQIKDTRYLAVQQTDWTLNNKEEVTIPFSSSHDCEITNLTATKTSFFKTSGSSDYGVHETKPVTGVSATFIDEKGSLKITHALDNRLLVGTSSNSSMDISPIEISFTLRHKDDPNFAEVIHITQYPAIWVETELNSAGTNGNAEKGYIWINGGRTSSNGGWQTAQGASGSYTNTGDNTCRYFVTIHVSQFDATSNTEGFVIGDPRKDEVDNLTDYRASIGATDYKAYSKYLDQNNQSLTYYRPTIPARLDEANTRKLYVSPVYRVCTSHAKNYGDGSYEQVMYRCATYQEDGYPAGRWRVPTYAEYKLFRYISDAKLIPNLFVTSGNYYCAGGRFSGLTYKEDFDEDDVKGAVRCVYDEWYWSQVDDKFGWDNNNKTDFVWGDVPVNF